VLHDFLNANRILLIERCQGMVASRSRRLDSHPELANGIPILVDQIIKMLMIERGSDGVRHPDASSEPGRESNPDVGPAATLHGRDLLREGYTIEQVIRDYGDLCQAVTNLAVELGATISANEFRTFNRCLDDAMAAAVTEYSQQNSQIVLSHSEAALAAAQHDAREARSRALHDSLTGLPNRELFDDRLTHAIALATRHQWTLAVMFLDLDRFKDINDVHGHSAGDAALKTIAQRLLYHVRDEDTVCRNGGDEFLYVLMNPRGPKNIERVANSVLKTIAQPLSVANTELSIKPSIGIAMFPEHGASGDELIKNADAAMYGAKRHSRGIAFFDRLKVREQIA